MRKTNSLSVLCGMALLALFGAALVQLWHLRFAVGDVYPAYSSLRADPLGVKALYESLSRLPGHTVQRHYRRFAELQGSPTTTLFLLGLPALYLEAQPESTGQALEAFVRQGGRLVMAFAPVAFAAGSPAEEKPAEATDPATPPAIEKREEAVSLTQRWGVQSEMIPAPAQPLQSAEARARQPERSLPDSVPWHSAMVWQDLDPAWQVLYTYAEQPVLIERPLGKGTLVLCSDTYLFSNEALWRQRQTALLAWMVGAQTTVVFDETHLGGQEEAGVMTLVRRYRLHGALCGLFVLAVLFVWKHTTSLVPPDPAAEDVAAGATVTGQAMLAGLVNLLQQHIAPGDLLPVCIAEWHKSAPQEPPGRVAQMQRAIDTSPRQEHLVEVYRTLCQIAQTKGM